jgi:hypothetical protein
MGKPSLYGKGPYGAGRYERSKDPWPKPVSCLAGTWTPFVMTLVDVVASATSPPPTPVIIRRVRLRAPPALAEG